jgi:serine/threonine-protein kinase TTK/MPS1
MEYHRAHPTQLIAATPKPMQHSPHFSGGPKVMQTPQAQRTQHTTIPLTPVTLPKSCITVNNVQYAVFQEIGRGGSSTVVKAFSPNYQILAIKTVRYSDPREFNLYMKEVESLQRFRGNQSIIQLQDYEVDEEEGLIQMVLELGEIDLHKLLVQHRKQCGKHWKPLPENTLRHYWQQMLEAVHEIHEANVIHTDLKPANFLMVQGKLKLIDFGIADMLDDDCTSIERDCALGTPSYLSPEACTAGPRQTWEGNRCKVGRPADVWSLGIILYQLVYGVTPFCKLGKYHKMLAIPDPKYPIDWYPVNNADLLDVMQRCLQRDPKLRPTIPELLHHPFLFPSGASMT